MKFVVLFAALLALCSALPQPQSAINNNESPEPPNNQGEVNLPGLSTSNPLGPINVPGNPEEPENLDGDQSVDSENQLSPSDVNPGSTIFLHIHNNIALLYTNFNYNNLLQVLIWVSIHV